MTLPPWLGILGAVALAVFVLFAFRQAEKVKPDKNNRDDWARHDGDSHGGADH